MSEATTSRKVCFLLDDGTVVFPCAMQNRATGRSTFRVSRYGGNQLNHADPKEREEEVTEDEMLKFVLDLGYSVRVQRANGEKNIFSPNSPKVEQVYVPAKTARVWT